MLCSILNSRGSTFLITIALIGMLTLVALMAVDYSTTDVDVSFNQLHEEKAFYAAESGVARAMKELAANTNWRAGYSKQIIGSESYIVKVFDSSTQVGLGDTLRIVSTGSSETANSKVEVLLVKAAFHPLYNHAIYAGNREEYNPSLPDDSQSYTYSMDFGGTGSSADSITGDIWMNGNASVNGNAGITGAVDVGGSYSGNSPSDTVIESASYLEPPDLKAMNYETTSDFKIDNSASWDASGRLSSVDPRHIFVKEFRSDLEASTGFTFDNTNYFFGDPWEGSNIDRVSVSSSGNHKTYFVDGNVWIEPQGQTSQIINSPSDGTQITIVAKGNIYFSDNLLYDNPNLDALAFIAMTDGESYTDMDGDNQYTPGEPILHDDGDGIYEGPVEGSGNVFFGDPNGGPLGHVYSYIYAENNFEDHVLDPAGDPLNFEVTGMFSAGNLVRIQRDFSGTHAQMKVNYDPRLKNGTITLPGLPPQNVSAGDWVAVSWRELYD